MKKFLFGLLLCAFVFSLSLFSGCKPKIEKPPQGDILPVVTGVTNGTTYVYGVDEVIPVFDIGMATLKKDQGIAEAFKSGTKVAEKGMYLLVVTNNTKSVTVNFTIAVLSNANQMIDMFEGNQLSSEYITLGEGISGIDTNGDMKLQNISAAETTWSFIKRQFTDVDVKTYPYIELEIGDVSAGLASFKLSSTATPALSSEEIGWTFETGGKYYINAAQAFADLGLKEQGDSVWLHIGKGREAMDIDYYVTVKCYKSISRIPDTSEPASAYVDKTKESMNQWKASTANLKWFEGEDCATGVVTGAQEYGKVLKRVQLNTQDYPFLIVDIKNSKNCSWSMAYKYVDFSKNQSENSLARGEAGKTEIYLPPLIEETKCADIILYFYIVGSGSLEVNGFINQAEPIFEPVVKGIFDDEIVNLNLFEVAPQFDKGTATLAKDGGEKTVFVNGTKITEPGSYELTVKYGKFIKVIRFKALKPAIIAGQLDDYCSAKGFAQRNPGETELELIADGVKFTKTSGDAWTEISKQYTMDLSINNYLVLDIRKSGTYTPDISFALELICDTVAPWYICAITDFANMRSIAYDGGWKIYIKTDIYSGDTEKVKNANVKFAMSLGFGGPKSVILHDFSQITQTEYEKVFEVTGNVLDNYQSLDGFTKRNPGETELELIADGVKFTKTSGDAWTGLVKNYTLDLSVYNYLVLDIKKSGTYTPDAGFSFEFLCDTIGPWYNYGIAGFEKMKTVAYDGGWKIYIKTDIYGGEAEKVKKASVKFTIAMGFGGPKSVILHDFSKITQTEYEKVFEVTGNVLDNYQSLDGFTKRNPGETELELIADGVKFTKTSGDAWTGLIKNYTLDLSVYNYLVLDIKKSGTYTPDAGFSFEFLCDTIGPWYNYGIAGFEKMKTVAYDGGWKIYIKTDIYGGEAEKVKKASVKFTIAMGFGGSKSVILHDFSKITQTEYEKVFEVTGNVLDNYQSLDGFTKRNPGETELELIADGVKFTKTSGDAWTGLIKNYTLDLSVYNYLVLDIKKSGTYTPDAGFSFEFLCDTIGPWYNYGIAGFEKMKTVAYDGGWKIYIKTDIYGGEAEKVKKASVKFTIAMGFGGPKSVILHDFSQITQTEYEKVFKV